MCTSNICHYNHIFSKSILKYLTFRSIFYIIQYYCTNYSQFKIDCFIMYRFFNINKKSNTKVNIS